MGVRSSSARQLPRGFTLIEIMVAVAILSMIAVIMYGTMTATIRGRRVAYNLQERYQTARVAMNRMITDLSSAYLSKHRNMDKYPETMFKGSRDRIDFTYLGHVRMVEGSRVSDQGAVSFFLENDRDNPGTKALMRREKVPIDDRPEKGGVVYKLAENVKKVRFEYWDPKDQEWERDWKAEMPDNEPMDVPGQGPSIASKVKKAQEVLSDDEDEFILPSRVRIELVLGGDDGKEYAFESQARIYMREPLAW